MGQPENSTPKSPTSHLHVMNLVVALLAGVISITGGIYSLKNNLFSGPAYGSVQGIVRDARIARPLKLAAVEITDLAGAVVNTAETNDDGHYLIESLKTGNYVVKFTAPLHKVETKTIKIEKDLASSVSVDLVPEIPQTSFASTEAVATVPQNITAPSYQSSAPAATYPTATPAAPSYNATGVMSPGTTASSTYPSSQPVVPNASYPNSNYPGRHHSRRYPGGYDQTSSTNTTTSTQGSDLAAVGTQLLSAFMASKSNNSTTNN